MLTLVALAYGCAHAPPGETFERDVAAAGIGDPIQFVVTGMPVDADVADDGPTLSLADAVRRTLANDTGVQAALARTRSALADARQARLLPNPVLSVAFRFPEGGGKPVIEAGLAADLISLLSRPRQISAADHRLCAASSEAVTVVLDTLADVQRSYAVIQAGDAEIEVLNERRNLIGRLLDLAKARLNKGEGTQLDVTTFQTQQVELDTEIAERQLEQRQERLTLARLLGQPSGKADWRLTKWEAPHRIAASEADWIGAALNRRPEVNARRWELAALGDEYALSRLAIFEGTEVGADSERDDIWTVGPAVSVPVPLFDWGQARRAKANAQVIEARHNYTQTRRQVVEEVRKALASYTSSTATLETVRTKLLPLQEQRRQQTESAYLAGQTDITALLVAEQDLQAARTRLVELQQKTSEAFIQLQRAAGGAGLGPAATTSTSIQATTQNVQ